MLQRNIIFRYFSQIFHFTMFVISLGSVLSLIFFNATLLFSAHAVGNNPIPYEIKQVILIQIWLSSKSLFAWCNLNTKLFVIWIQENCTFYLRNNYNYFDSRNHEWFRNKEILLFIDLPFHNFWYQEIIMFSFHSFVLGLTYHHGPLVLDLKADLWMVKEVHHLCTGVNQFGMMAVLSWDSGVVRPGRGKLEWSFPNKNFWSEFFAYKKLNYFLFFCTGKVIYD